MERTGPKCSALVAKSTLATTIDEGRSMGMKPQSRRQLCHSMLLAPLAAASPLCAGGVLLLPRRLHAVEPATVILTLQAISGAANLYQSFMSSDGGLGATLAAGHQKLDLVIYQMSQIQGALSSILEKINELPEKYRAILAEEFTRQDIATIKGHLETYNYQIAPFIKPTKPYLDPGDAYDRAQQIVADMVQRVSKLRNYPGAGISWPCAFIAPAAMLTESLCRIALKQDQLTLKRALAGYCLWFDRMLQADLPTSIIGQGINAFAETINITSEMQATSQFGLAFAEQGFKDFKSNAISAAVRFRDEKLASSEPDRVMWRSVLLTFYQAIARKRVVEYCVVAEQHNDFAKQPVGNNKGRRFLRHEFGRVLWKESEHMKFIFELDDTKREEPVNANEDPEQFDDVTCLNNPVKNDRRDDESVFYWLEHWTKVQNEWKIREEYFDALKVQIDALNAQLAFIDLQRHAVRVVQSARDSMNNTVGEKISCP
jgi:hypothetical protein